MPHIAVFAFLQWITFNPQPVAEQQFSFGFYSIPNSSFTLIAFNSSAPLSNSLRAFKINVLVVDCTGQITNIAYYSMHWSGYGFPPNFNAPLFFGKPLFNYTCFYSFYSLYRPNSQASYFLFLTSGYDINNANGTSYRY
jgi:hypothetical protein